MPVFIGALIVFGIISWACPAVFKYLILGPLLGIMFGGMSWGISFAFVDLAGTRMLLSFQTFFIFVGVATLLVDAMIAAGDLKS
jgi:hypothetical protein